MSYHLVEQLFVCKDNLVEKNAILVYSFMMHTSCGRSRYHFLDPMVGICFCFETKDDIEANRTRLNDLWADPSNFLTFGNYCLQRDTKDRKIKIIVDAFTDMKRLFTRASSYGRSIENERKWLMLCAYIFSFWLKRESNSAIRSQVESLLKSNPPSVTATVPGKDKKGKKMPHTQPFDTTTTTSESVYKRQCLNNSTVDTSSTMNRLWSPDASNRHPNHQNKQAMLSQVNITIEQEAPVASCPNFSRSALLEKDWSSIQLMMQVELDELTASYLLVHTDGGLDILSKLTPLEVYSADRLKDFRHSRLCGPPKYKPHQQLGDVVLHIGSGCDEYLDKHSKLFHVVRQRSVYFKEYYKILPCDQLCANLCKSILKYGTIDNTRSRCQYRVTIGCGGQHFPEGIPATLIGKSFAAKLDTDAMFDREEILSTIGSLVEFLWRVGADIQRDVCDAPLAPDSIRWNAYAKHLCSYLFITHDHT